MTRNDSDDAVGPVSRRTLLRRTGATAGALGAAVTVGATPAAATNSCPRTRHYWSHTEWPPHVTRHLEDPMSLAGEARSRATWKLMLGMDLSDDRTGAMAQQLLTAKLNLLLRPDPDPTCVNRELSAFEGRTVEGARNAAAYWLYHSTFGDPEPQYCWTVKTDDGPLDGQPLFQLLGHYNNGDLDELSCDCVLVPDDDGDDFTTRFADGTCGGSSPRLYMLRRWGLEMTADGQLVIH